MEKIVEKTLLYDFYGELLTEHQRQIYEDVVFNDISLSEAAEEYGVSRQGIHDLIRRCDKLLQEYEEKLKLVSQFERLKKLVAGCEEILLREELTEADRKNLLSNIEEIKTEIE